MTLPALLNIDKSTGDDLTATEVDTIAAAIDAINGHVANGAAALSVNASDISGTTIDATNYAYVRVALNQNVVVQFQFPSGYKKLTVEFVQDATGSRTVTLNGVDAWGGGYAPVFASAANASTVVDIETYDGGATQYGLHGQEIITARFIYGGSLAASSTGQQPVTVMREGRLLSSHLAVRTAPTGTLTVDVNKNGTTVYTTQGNRPTIAASGTSSSTSTNMDVTALAAGDRLWCDIDGTTGGADLTVTVQWISV